MKPERGFLVAVVYCLLVVGCGRETETYYPCGPLDEGIPQPRPDLDLLITSGDGSSELSGLTEVSVRVMFCDNPDLQDLHSLQNIAQISGLVINRCANLTSAAGLENLEIVDGPFFVTHNPRLIELRSASSLQFVGDTIGVFGNERLESLELSDTLMHVGGAIRIQDVGASIELPSGPLDVVHLELSRNSVTTISGLENQLMADTIWIERNENLTTLSTFSSLTSVGMLHIYQNYSLTSLVGLDSLESVDSLLVSSVGSLDGLQGLRHVDGTLAIRDASVETLSPLSNLLSIGGLGVMQLSNLQTLDGLDSLESVDLSTLWILNNPVLTDVSALHGVKTVNDEVRITDNPALPTCRAEELIAEIEPQNILGEIIIEGNDDTATCP